LDGTSEGGGGQDAVGSQFHVEVFFEEEEEVVHERHDLDD
jgi:hypothetical protein